MIAKYLANLVSLSRVFLIVFALDLLISPDTRLLLAGLGMIVASFSLDAVDGFIARKLGTVSYLGSFVDLVADRFTELLLFFWILNAQKCELVPQLIVVIFYFRILLVDFARLFAYKRGYILPSGPNLQGTAKALNLSRLSRAGYAAFKAAYFVTMIFLVNKTELISPGIFWISTILSTLLLAFSLLRGAPIVQMAISILRNGAPGLVPRHSRTDDLRANLICAFDCVGIVFLFVAVHW